MSFTDDLDINSGKSFNKRKSRLEKLATPKMRLDNSTRTNAFQVRPGALTYEISKNVNKLAQPKQKHSSHNYKYASSSFLTMAPTLKPENLIKEASVNREASLQANNESSKIETYAKIAATRKTSNYLRRLYDFPKPVKKSIENFNSENKFSQLMRNYNSKNNR